MTLLVVKYNRVPRKSSGFWRPCWLAVLSGERPQMLIYNVGKNRVFCGSGLKGGTIECR